MPALQTYIPGFDMAPPPQAEPKPVREKVPPVKKGSVPRREMTADEQVAVKCLQVTYTPASWDKRFARDMSSITTITEKEAAQVWRLFHRYRRQITHPHKEHLLQLAIQRAAPELRRKPQ